MKLLLAQRSAETDSSEQVVSAILCYDEAKAVYYFLQHHAEDIEMTGDGDG